MCFQKVPVRIWITNLELLRPLILPLLLLIVAHLNNLCHAESELIISSDFQVAELHNMPGPVSHPGLRFQQTDYPEANAVEWQTRLQAPAGTASPHYQDLKSADFAVRFPISRSGSEQGVTLHWSKGSHAEVTDFQPATKALVTGVPITLESFGGRSSDGVLPYFNLACNDGGIIIAVGWSGDWKAGFELQSADRVKITAGLQQSKFRLPLGEELRLPSVLVMTYQGSWLDGQNRFRRLMLRHFTPQNDRPMDLMPLAASVHGMFGFNDTSEENLRESASEIAAWKLPLDTFWLDAGWNQDGFPSGQGNLNADPRRFPNGLAPVGRQVHQTGMRFLVWFEPERAMVGSWLDREHSDWLLSPSGTPTELRYLETDGFRLLNFGNSNARQWALETVSQHLRAANISVYRQDFNAYPAYFWHTDQSPDQVGLSEVRYINGLYDYLDALARSNPGLIIDSCASGGRRIDFEMMRRSVLLWRSDSCWDDASFPRNVQAMTYGLSHWLPLHGLGALRTDEVSLRSGMGACGSFAINYRDPNAVAALRNHLQQYRKIRRLFAADFFPLTDGSLDSKKWLAFQFHDPETGEGIIQAFCGADGSERSLHLKPMGLDASKRYAIADWDHLATPKQWRGAELIESGIEVRVRDVDQAIVLHYIPTP